MLLVYDAVVVHGCTIEKYLLVLCRRGKLVECSGSNDVLCVVL